MREFWVRWMPWVAAVLALAGCGGGSGGGSSSGLSLFITDDLSTHAHVWVSVKRISVTPPGGTSVTLFDESTTPRVVDLRTLRDTTGARFKFLASRAVSFSQIAQVDVVLDDDVVLFPAAATTGLARKFSGAVAGEVTLTKTFSTPKTLGVDDDFIIDFKLGNWVDDGTLVTASIDKLEDSTVTNLGRHEREDYRGTVANLQGTAPTQTFTINVGGAPVTVVLSANTLIYNSNGAPNPVLANASVVEVRGAFDTGANRILADGVKIKVGEVGPEDPHEFVGVPSNIAADTFDLEVRMARGILPLVKKIGVTTSATTRYFGRRGVSLTKDEFFAALPTTPFVEAEGTLDENHVLAATKLKLENGPGDHQGEAEARGAPSEINAGAKTFKVTATLFRGINLAPGSLLNVETGSTTAFRQGPNTLTETQFYTQLATATAVEVEGVFNPDTRTLVAKKAKIEDGAGGDDGEARGSASLYNAEANTIQLVVSSFLSLPLTSGQTITVVVNGSTVYRDDRGNIITKSVFFTTAAPVIEAEGVYDTATQRLTATKLKIQD